MTSSSFRGPERPGRGGPLLDEQSAYYSAIAPEYRDHWLPFPGGDELEAAVEAFQPKGNVLELACGPGVWTEQLSRHAAEVTAVDGSSEMLDIASARIKRDGIKFVHADIFSWTPSRRYDVVFFGFWLSHVPPELFNSFWSLVADCLEPRGRILFVDDAYRSAEELTEGRSSVVVRRQLNDGTPFRIVKVPHEPAELELRLAQIGWSVTVRPTAGPFYWGAGTRADKHDQPPGT